MGDVVRIRHPRVVWLMAEASLDGKRGPLLSVEKALEGVGPGDVLVTGDAFGPEVFAATQASTAGATVRRFSTNDVNGMYDHVARLRADGYEVHVLVMVDTKMIMKSDKHVFIHKPSGTPAMLIAYSAKELLGAEVTTKSFVDAAPIRAEAPRDGAGYG